MAVLGFTVVTHMECVRVFVYVCMYMCVCVCMYVTYVYLCMYVYVCIYVYVCVSICTGAPKFRASYLPDD